MIRLQAIFLFVLVTITTHAQTVPARLATAWKQFESDPQLRTAISSLYVIDAQTGAVVFDRNSSLGLAPASTLKVITAASAYELLGKDFRYLTEFSYGTNAKGEGILMIKPSGDPTLGSWRYRETKEDDVMKRIITSAQKQDLKFHHVAVDHDGWNEELIPRGWTWQDIGNYYGAGAAGLNWRENQFDITLRGGSRIGEPVTIKATKPKLYGLHFSSLVTSGPKGTGDRSYIFYSEDRMNAPAPGDLPLTIRGTIPVNETLTISGSLPAPDKQFAASLLEELSVAGMRQNATPASLHHAPGKMQTSPFHEEISPAMDSMVYWFLRKSVNLYGEAFVKTIAFNARSVAATDSGTAILKRMWQSKGIHPAELNIIDGSGLSPENRVTTHAQVKVLHYARKQPWFDGFYEGFPLYNRMKMKSGTISGVKGFAGYHRSSSGREYIFSFIVNNYYGGATALTDKMFRVLDVLK